MRDSVWSEVVRRHLVLSGVPLDLRLERVNHELAVDVADAAAALGRGHLVERRGELDGEADLAAVAAAFVGLGPRDGFARCWGYGCLGRHDGDDCS